MKSVSLWSLVVSWRFLSWSFGTALAVLDDKEVILVKIGGSSITYKAQRESLDREALNWFADALFQSISDSFLAPRDETSGSFCTTKSKNLAFIVVHGAGSFGHFSAKEYGLKGQTEPAAANVTSSMDEKRLTMRGIAETRLSVQTLNRHVVESFVARGINAVGISPCFGVLGVEAHAGAQLEHQPMMERLVRETVRAGLVPVLHGDACLHGPHGGGILSGDTIMEILGTREWIDHSVFITDVDGVYTEDPRSNPDAELLRLVQVDLSSGTITTKLSASSSSHEHDVTGGLAVSILTVDTRRYSVFMSPLTFLVSFQTKLQSAASIAASGKNVTIVKCQSTSAEQALRAEPEISTGTKIISRVA
jgi:isopentenyl phosphate kinase